MDDYDLWAKWLEKMYNEIKRLSVEMNKPLTHKKSVSLRKEYVKVCSDWITLCDIMRSKIEFCKEKAQGHLEDLKIET